MLAGQTTGHLSTALEAPPLDVAAGNHPHVDIQESPRGLEADCRLPTVLRSEALLSHKVYRMHIPYRGLLSCTTGVNCAISGCCASNGWLKSMHKYLILAVNHLSHYRFVVGWRAWTDGMTNVAAAVVSCCGGTIKHHGI